MFDCWLGMHLNLESPTPWLDGVFTQCFITQKHKHNRPNRLKFSKPIKSPPPPRRSRSRPRPAKSKAWPGARPRSHTPAACTHHRQAIAQNRASLYRTSHRHVGGQATRGSRRCHSDGGKICMHAPECVEAGRSGRQPGGAAVVSPDLEAMLGALIALQRCTTVMICLPSTAF